MRNLTNYLNCPCWSIIPGKSANCIKWCDRLQRDTCTNAYNKDNENAAN